MGDRVVLWDFDGTLGWREGGWAGCLLDLLHAGGWALGATAAQLRAPLAERIRWHAAHLGHPALARAEDWWEELAPLLREVALSFGATPEDAARIQRAFRQRYLEPGAWRVFDDAVPCLEALTKAGWAQEVATNNVPELEAVLAGLGLRRHFRRVHCSAWMGHEKPHPAFYQAVLGTLKPGTQTWMVGDDLERDYLGARQAGMAALLVRRHSQRAEHYLPDLSGLPGLLAGRVPGLGAA